MDSFTNQRFAFVLGQLSTMIGRVMDDAVAMKFFVDRGMTQEDFFALDRLCLKLATAFYFDRTKDSKLP